MLNDNITKTINNLDSDKAHGHGMISIRMSKVCGPSLCKSLSIFLNHALVKWNFPWNGKNLISIRSTKKNDKQCIKNCRPVSLLLICSNIFVRVLFNKFHKFFNENDLLSSNQSGFQPGDSSINQLLSITREIFESFDNDLKESAVF